MLIIPQYMVCGPSASESDAHLKKKKANIYSLLKSYQTKLPVRDKAQESDLLVSSFQWFWCTIKFENSLYALNIR